MEKQHQHKNSQASSFLQWSLSQLLRFFLNDYLKYLDMWPLTVVAGIGAVVVVVVVVPLKVVLLVVVPLTVLVVVLAVPVDIISAAPCRGGGRV